MSRENVEIVVGLFESTNARDFDAAMAVYADEVELYIHDWLAGPSDRAIGKRAIGAWFAEWFRGFADDYRFEIHDARDWGERVLIDATHHARGRASGAPFERRAAWVYTLRAGRVVRCDSYPDLESALAAERPGGD